MNKETLYICGSIVLAVLCLGVFYYFTVSTGGTVGALSFGNFQASSTSVGVTSTLVVGRNTGRKCLRAADLTTGGYVSCTFNNSTSSAVLNKGIIFGTNTTTTLNFAIGCGLTDIRTEDFQCVANTTSTISWTQD